MINGKKAILILGAISAMNEIVIDAKKMGYYTIVTDNLENSLPLSAVIDLKSN